MRRGVSLSVPREVVVLTSIYMYCLQSFILEASRHLECTSWVPGTMKGEAGEPGAPAVDPEEVSLLRATVQELRAMLDAERTQAR